MNVYVYSRSKPVMEHMSGSLPKSVSKRMCSFPLVQKVFITISCRFINRVMRTSVKLIVPMPNSINIHTNSPTPNINLQNYTALISPPVSNPTRHIGVDLFPQVTPTMLSRAWETPHNRVGCSARLTAERRNWKKFGGVEWSVDLTEVKDTIGHTRTLLLPSQWLSLNCMEK